MEKDRDYYRCLETKELIEEVRRGVRVNWQELAIVLAERMDTWRREVYDEFDD